MPPAIRNLLIGLGALLALGLIVALAVSASSDAQSSRIRTADVTVDGELPPFPGVGVDDPAIGMQAPSIEGISFGASEVTVTPGDGRPYLLFFLAHWCPACQEELPKLSNWYETAEGVARDAEDERARVVLVSTSVQPTSGNYPPAAWFAREGWQDPVLVDSKDAEAFSAYGGTGYPYLVVIDGEGKVEFRATGLTSPELWDQLVSYLNTGEMPF